MGDFYTQCAMHLGMVARVDLSTIPGQLAKSFDMPSASIEFGYLPMALDFKVGSSPYPTWPTRLMSSWTILSSKQIGSIQDRNNNM